MNNNLELQLNELLLDTDGRNEIFIIDGAGEYSRAQCALKVMQIAIYLKNLGLNSGDKVLYSLSKNVDQACIVMACYLSGIVFVPLLPNQSGANVKHIISDCEPNLIISDNIEGFENFKVVLLDDLIAISEHIELTEFGLGSTFSHDALAAIIYSSGSTGRPKGICFSRRNVSDGAEIVSKYKKIDSSDVILSPLSLNFDYGLNQLWVSVLKKCRLILHEFTYSISFMKLVQKYRPTIIPLMPVFIGSIIDPRLISKAKSFCTKSVRLVTTSGGAVSENFQDGITELFPTADLMLMYGLTEAFRSTYLEPSERLKRKGSIGKAIPGARVWVGDEKLQPLPPGTIGQIYHEGGCMSLGYWRMEQKNNERFLCHPDLPNKKILATGDLGYEDEDGFIYFSGRADSMIKSRGHRISPYEIEAEIVRFTGIKSAIVTSIPDELLTNLIVVAYIEDDSAAVNIQALKLMLSKSLASHQVPDIFLKFEEFPTTGNQGKIDIKSVQKSCLEILSDAKNK